MATYPTHGVHLRQRHPNRWLLVAVVVVAALVGVGAWALVDHYTGGTTKATTGPATLTSTGIANKYIAALEELHPSTLTPILAKDAVSVDFAYGSGPPFRSAKTLENNWAGVFATSGVPQFRASLRAATPDWAAVSFRLRGSTNPITYEPFTMNGLSILNIQNGKIVRETYYWDVPGRNPGIAGTVGTKFATTLPALKPTTVLALGSLYNKNAAEVDMAGTVNGRVNKLTWHMGTPTNLIWARPGPGWTRYLKPLHASLCCAGPSFRMDNGTIRNGWAVVNWVGQLHSPGGKVVSGLSILQLNKQGEIIRETLYY